MTTEEIHEAIKQVQAQAMSLHRYNSEISASCARTDTPLCVERVEWWGSVLIGAMIGAAITWTLLG